jgi:hypothetical protein
LLLRVGRTSRIGNEVTKTLTTSTNDRAVELVLDRYCVRLLLMHLLGDLKDGRFRCRDIALVATHFDVGNFAEILINVDLRASVVLNFLNRCTAASEDARDGTTRDRELDLGT